MPWTLITWLLLFGELIIACHKTFLSKAEIHAHTAVSLSTVD